MKIVVLTFDDGTIYDRRFIEILNKYHIPASLNLNSGLEDFVWNYNNEIPIHRLRLIDNVNLYKNHEVASHSLTHPYMTSLTKEEIIRQVKEDIDNLEKIFNREILTFAFPFTDYNDEVINIIKENTKVKNIRISKFSNEYMPQDRYHIHLNCYYNDPHIYERLEEFSNNSLDKSLFTIVGHSYEFEVLNEWDKIESLIKYLSENKKITILTLDKAMDELFDE